nr:amidase family protein [uncultured Salipiger sp.]
MSGFLLLCRARRFRGGAASGGGAICLGKANLDRFATGLVGARSPYPVPRNALDPASLPGGSSSGSAVAVAQGIATFSLGADTAGSGRVPAALNGIVGLKPSLGALSATGMVPACRTLDTISVFALTVSDAWAVFAVAEADAYSRPMPAPVVSPLPPRLRIAVPTRASLVTDGDDVQAAIFHETPTRLRTTGAEVVELPSTRSPACPTRAPEPPSAPPHSGRASAKSPRRCIRSPGRSSRAGWS